jgi:hypothetical protein
MYGVIQYNILQDIILQRLMTLGIVIIVIMCNTILYIELVFVLLYPDNFEHTICI